MQQNDPRVGASILLIWAASWSAGLEAYAGEPARSGGVVVERVRPGAAAGKAGILPGDLLLAWRRPSESGPGPRAAGSFSSPFHLSEVEREEGCCRRLVLRGLRDGEPLTFEVPSGAWGLEVRPELPHEALALYQEAKKRLAEEGRPEDAGGSWKHLTAELVDRRVIVAVWLALDMGAALSEAGRMEEARAAMAAADRDAETLGEPRIAARVKEALGDYFRHQGDLETAAGYYRASLELRKTEDVGTAVLLNRLGESALARGDLDGAMERFQQALRIAERSAPGTLTLADSQKGLATVLGQRSDFSGAAELLRRSMAIQEQLDPPSGDLANTLSLLGIVGEVTGDFAAARENYRRALEIAARFDDGLTAAGLRVNLGVLEWMRGDLAVAEQYFWQALEGYRRLAPEGSGVAKCLANLGGLSKARDKWDEAEHYFRLALELEVERAPRTLAMANLLHALGDVDLQRGDLDRAEERFRRSLTLAEELAPGGLPVAFSVENLGRVEVRRGEFGRAEELFQDALDIKLRAVPGSLEVAGTLDRLAEAAIARGELGVAETRSLEALAISERLAPGSRVEALSCHRLGVIFRRQGRLDDAEAYLSRAVAALESQQNRLGGEYESQAGFAASGAPIYHDLIDLLIERGEVAAAFHVSERSRNRAFLELLSQRDLQFAEVPEELRRERRLADRQYDRALGKLARMSIDDGDAELEALTGELEGARRRQREARARIRALSPRLASAHAPRAVDLETVTAFLETGTLLLSYNVGEERSHVFAVGPAPDEIRVFHVEAGEDALRERIERFRSLLRPAESPEAIQFRAERLGELLLAPVSDLVSRSERLLVLPDNPLHALPFSALVLPDDEGRRRYLIERKPVTVVASATLFDELKNRRRRAGEVRLSAFGDPAYPPASARESAGPALRGALENGLRLDPLPATRTEVEALRRIFPESSRIYLGAAATEKRAKSPEEDSNVFHFACHGIVDDRFPLESALALSIAEDGRSETENGLLQAWEIIEQMRIQADLVTLSGCDTALGMELSGEGMVGLARAFQYAGARSVLASLWAVTDASTARLMERFYVELRRGTAKDEALRRAQLSLLGGEARTAHPHHWAAFRLIGDWR